MTQSPSRAELDPQAGAPAVQPAQPTAAPSTSAGRGAPSLPHESGHKHVTGAAVYVDDEAARRAALEVWPVMAPHARARILRRDAARARALPGVRAVLLADDIPGLNDVGAIRHDEPLLAEDAVSFHGQAVALVVADSIDAARRAAAAVEVDYEPLAPTLTIEAAIEQGAFHTDPHTIRRGEPARALAEAPRTLEGELHIGGQEHFYLETHAAFAAPGEDGAIFVSSSTQHPTEIQTVVARVLGVPRNAVVCESPRMGGGFGGKETQGNAWAALAALAARRTGRPVRVRPDRDLDMRMTGKRHPFLARFRAGFDADGRLLALSARLFSNGGWTLDLSGSILDRALFHIDNAYYIPNVHVEGRVVRTNLPSFTAFRGFGGPQGMVVIEEVLARVARATGLPPEAVRERNLYGERGAEATTHYGQTQEDVRIRRIWGRLLESSSFAERRRAAAAANDASPHRKRGLAITPVKFGISFTATHLNQAGALVLVYADGSVQVNHGGTEMGQGLHTKMRSVAARELGVRPERIRVMHTRTDKVPNTSATAASSGSDLNGQAVKAACAELRRRLTPIAAALLGAAADREQVDGALAGGADVEVDATSAPPALRFEDGRIHAADGRSVAFDDAAQAAWMRQVSLSATGFYRTPDLHYDRAAGRGKPFHYFAYGAAVSEVEVCGFTGAWRLLRADILHDVGASLNEGIDRGQVEGGYIQGVGWLTMEELVWDGEGRLLTAGPSTYNIPAVSDAPRAFHVELLPDAAQRDVIHGSKAVGEPPLMLAISVREALRDAVAAFGPPGGDAPLGCPSTTEAILAAIDRRRGAAWA